MQRAAPQGDLASVFATLEALSLIGTVIGSIVVQVLIATAGVRAALTGLRKKGHTLEKSKHDDVTCYKATAA